jgi:hypothetical protein
MESIFSHSLGHGGTTVSLDELLAGFSTLEELVGSAAEDAGSVAEDVGSAAEELMGAGREAEETPEET